MRLSILIIISFVCLNSCATGLVEWNGDTYAYGYDFTSYTEKGFLFTPESYTQNYEAIGMIELVIYPRIREAYSGADEELDSDNSRVVKIAGTYYRIEIPKSSVLIDDMYQQATSMGADALTNFQIIEIILSNNNLDIPSIKVSGFAINRNES